MLGTDDVKDSNQPAIKPMFDGAQLRLLKMAVVGMGVVLLLGFATIIGRIVYLLNRPAVDPAIVATASSGANPAILPPEIRLALPAGAVVRNLSLSGNRLAVHYEVAGGVAGIAIVDLGLGRATQKIELAPGK